MFSTKNLRALAVKAMGALALTGIFLGGALSAAASNPEFNNLSNDYPTLQVAKPGDATWSTSVNANVGETVNGMVWVHNTVVDTVAHNVRVKVTLPTAVATSHTARATVSADNAANTANGSSLITVGTESKISFIPGSAELLRWNPNTQQWSVVNFPNNDGNNIVSANGVIIPDAAGCWQYAQIVRFKMQIDGTTPAINTNKKVERAGQAEPFGDTAVAQPNDLINFKIFLENTGNGTGRSPKIVDTLNSKLTYVPNSSYMLIKQNNVDVRINIPDSNINFNGQTITWAFQDMAARPDAALYLIFQAKLADTSQFAVGTTTIPNCAEASFTGITKDTNCVTITVTRNPVIGFTLRKEVRNVTLNGALWYDQRLGGANPGDTVAYRLIVQNTGDTAATNVTLKDILPAEVTFAGNVKLYNAQNPNGLTISGNALVNAGYVFASIAPGTAGTQTIIFEGKVSDACNGSPIYNNVAKVIYQGVVKAQDNAEVAVSCNPGLVIRKDIKDPIDNIFKDDIGFVREGQVLTYRITVINNGNTTIVHPIVRDQLPEQVVYVNNSLYIDAERQSEPVQTAFLSTGMMITDLTPGMTKTITFQVKVKDCPPLGDIELINKAFVKANGFAEIFDTARAVVRVHRPGLNF